jgi:hypothetical protein
MASSGSSRQRRVESCKFVVVVFESLFFDFSLPSPGDNVLLPISSLSVSSMRLSDVVVVFVFFLPSPLCQFPVCHFSSLYSCWI